MNEDITPSGPTEASLQPTNYKAQLLQFESGLVQFLDQNNLPSQNIFTDVPQRVTVFNNVETVLPLIQGSEELKNSIYLSKFLAATASGLFDAALNYLWDETVLQLRKRVVQYDLEFFYDNAVNGGNRGNFKNEDDLEALKDADLILGCKKIGLISDIGYQNLDLIKYMRNHASAAHPNQNTLTGLQLITWLETCIREVITLPLSKIAVHIKSILSQIQSQQLTQEEANEIGAFFEDLPQDQANNLGLGFFGNFISAPPQTQKNIILLLPHLWDHIDEDTKETFGRKYAWFVANSKQAEKQSARRFLQTVDGESYIPDNLRVPEIDNILDQLIGAHRGMNNFYNEPTYARQLTSKLGDTPSVPKKVERKYVTTLVDCYLTNGNGRAWNADPYYESLIESFTARQAHLALLSFMKDHIASKLQFSYCRSRFSEVINKISPILTAPEYHDLIKALQKFKGPMQNARNDKSILNKVNAVRLAAQNLR